MASILNLVNTMMKSLLNRLFIHMEKEMSIKCLGVGFNLVHNKCTCDRVQYFAYTLILLKRSSTIGASLVSQSIEQT